MGEFFFNYLTYRSRDESGVASKIQTLSMNYQRNIFKDTYLRFSIGKNMSTKDRSSFASISLGLNLKDHSVNFETSKNAGVRSDNISIASSNNTPIGWSYNNSLSKTSDSKDIGYNVNISNKRQKFDTSLMLLGRGKDLTKQANISGSLIMMDDSFFFSKNVYNSFALVKVKDIPGIPIYSNNLPVGFTDKEGKAIVTNIPAYATSEIRLDEERLPVNSTFSSVAIKVSPKNRVGVIANFDVIKVRHAQMTLLDAEGNQLTPDTSVTIEGVDEDLFTGYNSLLYIEDIKELDILKGKAMIAEDKTCSFSVEVPDDVTQDSERDLGAVQCK